MTFFNVPNEKMSFSKLLAHAWRASVRPNLNRTISKSSRLLINKNKINSNEDLVINNTVITRDHLTPELQLRLITPECKLWHCQSTEWKFENDPFWAIYWPGGQALGRYILDNKELFCDKNVLDIGSGSGGCAIAAAQSGAKIVLANDIDPLSLTAIQINSQLNDVQVFTNKKDLIGKNIDVLKIFHNNVFIKPEWDVVLIGDMFYDIEFSFKLFIWLCKLVKKGKMVLIGDPGRHAMDELNKMTVFGSLIKVAEYLLTDKEHNGFSHTAVYKV